MRCPDCNKLIAPIFPLHDCNPKPKEKPMTFTNLSLAQIREFWKAEKPLYLEVTLRTDDKIDYPRRLRIHGIRTRNGQFQVKILDNGPKWRKADYQKVVCAY